MSQHCCYIPPDALFCARLVAGRWGRQPSHEEIRAIACPRAAEWTVWDCDEPDPGTCATEACTEHVGLLLTDGHRASVVPLVSARCDS